MYPARSLIMFTATSGAGFGLLALLGALAVADIMPTARMFSLVATLVAVSLGVTGLISASHHLGRPERLLLALTQWRTSWLSREGVAGGAAIIAALGFAVTCAWPQGAVLRIVAGSTTAALAIATVACTAMLYATLQPVPHWHSRLVLPVFVLLACMTGALLLVLLACGFGAWRPDISVFAVMLIVAAWVGKWRYWRRVGRLPAPVSSGMITGIDRFGGARLLESPLTAEGSELAEMGGGVPRPQAQRLRRVAAALLFALPLALTSLQPLLVGAAAVTAAAFAVIAAGVGVLVERWLFFAEARHVSFGWHV